MESNLVGVGTPKHSLGCSRTSWDEQVCYYGLPTDKDNRDPDRVIWGAARLIKSRIFKESNRKAFTVKPQSTE